MNTGLRIAIYGNPKAETPLLRSVADLIHILMPHCAAIDIVDDFYAVLSQLVSLPGLVKSVNNPLPGTDIIISIGGDGTFLRAVSWEGKGNVPIAGLNAGHLGYLTGWTLQEKDEFARAILQKDYRVNHRSLIKIETEGFDGIEWPYALNEVAVLKENSSNMISVRAEIDGNYLADYYADGLIVSTPTGSTGYNLSVGGPILEPQLPAWIISPVAAHALNMRPLVVSDQLHLRLEAKSRTDNVLLSLDGRSVSLPDKVALTLTKAPFTMPVVRRSHTTFADTLRDKLFWGVSKAPKG